jgi:hypothetical protein
MKKFKYLLILLLCAVCLNACDMAGSKELVIEIII